LEQYIDNRPTAEELRTLVKMEIKDLMMLLINSQARIDQTQFLNTMLTTRFPSFEWD
jgi:hypothetical protein